MEIGGHEKTGTAGATLLNFFPENSDKTNKSAQENARSGPDVVYNGR